MLASDLPGGRDEATAVSAAGGASFVVHAAIITAIPSKTAKRIVPPGKWTTAI
jgi:hypothetical protein